jgi:hypothetical protein
MECCARILLAKDEPEIFSEKIEILIAVRFDFCVKHQMSWATPT